MDKNKHFKTFSISCAQALKQLSIYSPMKTAAHAPAESLSSWDLNFFLFFSSCVGWVVAVAVRPIIAAKNILQYLKWFLICSSQVLLSGRGFQFFFQWTNSPTDFLSSPPQVSSLFTSSLLPSCLYPWGTNHSAGALWVPSCPNASTETCLSDWGLGSPRLGKRVHSNTTASLQMP